MFSHRKNGQRLFVECDYHVECDHQQDDIEEFLASSCTIIQWGGVRDSKWGKLIYAISSSITHFVGPILHAKQEELSDRIKQRCVVIRDRHASVTFGDGCICQCWCVPRSSHYHNPRPYTFYLDVWIFIRTHSAWYVFLGTKGSSK